MPTTVNVDEAQAELASLLDQVGQGREFVIAKEGRPLARLVPYAQRREPRTPGAWRGQVWISANFDALPEDAAAAFRGER